jgi:rhamnosyl/mannosyltransferase
VRILHIYKDYYPVLGGMENYIRLLAEDQVKRGHEVEVLVTSLTRRTEITKMAGVKVTKTSRWFNVSSAPLSPRLAVELLRCLYSKNPPDLIHLHAPYPVGEIAWLLGKFLPRFGKPHPKTIVTYQSDIIKQRRLLLFYAPILRLLLRKVTKIIATSDNYINSSPFLTQVAAKCVVIPLGVEVERFSHFDPTKVAQIKARYPEKRVLFVGRLRYYKSLNYLIDAMRQVDAGTKLLIIGIGQMEQALKQQTHDLGLNDKVHFLGEISDDDLPSYYAAADLFVLPSAERSEAFGAVLLEGMSAGLPVISTEIGTGTSWVNQHNQTGLVVPPRDPAALAKAINTILANPELQTRLGQNARIRALTHFKDNRVLDQINQLYLALTYSKLPNC